MKLNKNILLNKKILLILTIAYIYIPMAIFVLGYTKWYIGLITTVVCGFFLYQMTKSYCKEKDTDTTVQVSIVCCVIAVALIVAVCIFAGIGGIYPQAGDWYKHNAVLHDLSERAWPVVYLTREDAMLTYYIGQYLVGAVAGQITGSFQVGEVVMTLWAMAGILLVVSHLFCVTKANSTTKQLITVVVFLFFCGMLLPVQMILTEIYPDTMYSAGSYHWVNVAGISMQYRSNFVMLRWIYPQCIVPWLTAILFMEHRKKIEYYILLFLPSLLFGTFSFVAFVGLAIGMAVYELVIAKNKKRILEKCFNLSNLLPLFTLGAILFFYFLGNVSVTKPDYMSLHIQDYHIETIGVYILFCFFMFGCYGLLVWKENKKNPLFYLVILELATIPLFKMGLYNDFVMCTSIPGLFYLMIYVLQLLVAKAEDGSRGVRKGILIVCLLIGMWYPFMELSENIQGKIDGDMSADGYGTMALFTDRSNVEIQDDLKYNYYTYDLEKSIFYRFIAAK